MSLPRPRPRIAAMKAYHVEPYPAPVVLDANESPDILPSAVREEIDQAVATVSLNRYPDMAATALRQAVATKEGCAEDEILFGNGSDELILALVAAYCEPGETILVPSPTFTMYKQIASYFGVDTIEVPSDEAWEVDIDGLVAAMAEHRPKIVFLASPNNPTGHRLTEAAFERIAEAANETLIVLDEAYADFADTPSFGTVHRRWPHAILMKTLSKVGFAALRLGYMIGDARVIEEADKVRLPYNVNSLTQAAATVVVNRWDEIAPLFDTVRAERKRMFNTLDSMQGVTPFPSQANFILMRVDGDAERLFHALLDGGVRVRWFKGAPRLGDCFRVTIGMTDENDTFLAALAKAI